MNAAGPGCREADTELSRIFRICTGHKSSCFFVADLDKPNLVGALAQRFHNSVDAIPWQSKHHIDAPIVNGVNQHVRRRCFHARVLLYCWTSGRGILSCKLMPRGMATVAAVGGAQAR